LERAFESGFIVKKVYGKYEGNGIPPPYEMVALTEDEVRNLRDIYRQKVRGWEEDLVAHSKAMFELYDQKVPWKLLCSP